MTFDVLYLVLLLLLPFFYITPTPTPTATDVILLLPPYAYTRINFYLIFRRFYPGTITDVMTMVVLVVDVLYCRVFCTLLSNIQL